MKESKIRFYQGSLIRSSDYVALRAGVKDATVLKALIRFLSDNVGQLVNASRIANTLKSEGITTSTHTINRYLDLLEHGYLFYRATV